MTVVAEKASATPVQPDDDELRYPAADGDEEVTMASFRCSACLLLLSITT